MTAPRPTPSSLLVSWLLALMLAPLALAWCVVDAARTIRKIRRVGP